MTLGMKGGCAHWIAGSKNGVEWRFRYRVRPYRCGDSSKVLVLAYRIGEVIELRVESFSEIANEFDRRVSRDLCCNMATVDGRGRVRSRVVHPLWQGTTAYILTLPSSPKVAHISAHAHASLAYVGDEERPAYAECRAKWIDDPLEVKRIWETFRESPIGYEPGSFYGTSEVGVIRLTAWRIQVDDADGESLIWEAPN